MLKRGFDLLASAVGILLTLPVLTALAVWIKFDSPGPLLYRGVRVGRFGRPFRIMKFRTMVINAEKLGGSSTSDRDPRITKSGWFLRKCKLDELPQLFNVLLGDMSLVGPRPEVQQYVDMYTDEEQAILNLRPGITDWASIWNSDEGAALAGSDNPDRAYEELIRPGKLRLQLTYERRHSVWIDLKIIACTLYKLRNRTFLPQEVVAVLRELQREGRPLPAVPGYRPDPETAAENGFGTVTELPGMGATAEQLTMIRTRYRLAAELARDKDVLELACGPGIGLGYLNTKAKQVVAGDLDQHFVEMASGRYAGRVDIRQLDAQQLPFHDNSFDVILLLEAIYFLPDAERFVAEAHRVLRPNGTVMICSANRERPDFNACPQTHKYYSASELQKLLTGKGFTVELYAGFPTKTPGVAGRMLDGVRRIAVSLHLIPHSMEWKTKLKRLVFGKLDPIPPELSREEVEQQSAADLIPIDASKPVDSYKVIYAIGRRAA